MKSILKSVAIITTMLAVLTTTAEASNQGAAEPQFAPDLIASFAKKVEKEVAARGARVFIISRAGRPATEMPDGFAYTHVAFGVYSMITTEDGRQLPGYAIYNLYQRDKEPNVSDLVVDYPADFFAGVYQLKSGVVIPKPALQRQLLQVIASDSYRKLHNPAYSVIASPYTTALQNCTEHTLDVINAAIYGTDDLSVIKANERAYFDAQPVKVSPLKLMLGSISMPDVTTRDHKGGIKTASYTTNANYLQKYDLVQEQLTITP